MITEFFSGFWAYVSNLGWLQGLVTIFVVLVTFFIGKYWRNIVSAIGEKIIGSSKTDMLQYRMFWGLIRDVVQIQIKDEFRRSMHENSFAEMDDSEYILYVKDKSKLIMSLIKQHIVSLYPSNFKLKVGVDKIMEFLTSWQSELEGIVSEIFGEAKRIKLHNVQSLIKIDNDFIAEITDYIKVNHGTDNCSDCLMMLLGKREVAESRKRQIQTIKLQMNVAEQKLIELQSKLLTFYSDQLNKKKAT